MKKIRVFLAIPISDEVTQSVAKSVAEMAPLISGVRWVEFEGLHLTLKFFGDIEELEVVEISRTAQRIAATHKPFDFVINGMGAFPDIERPRTVWAGVANGAEPLGSLQSDLVGAFSDMGYPSESRKYHPHVTIGRVRDKSGMQTLITELRSREDVSFGTVRAEKVIVYSSELRRSGPIYTPLATCPLSGA